MNLNQMMALAERMSDRQIATSARNGVMPEMVAVSELHRRKQMRDEQPRPSISDAMMAEAEAYATGGGVFQGDQRYYDTRATPNGGEQRYFTGAFGGAPSGFTTPTAPVQAGPNLPPAPTAVPEATVALPSNEGDGAADTSGDATGAPGTGDPTSDVPNAISSMAEALGVGPAVSAAMGGLMGGPVGAVAGLTMGVMNRGLDIGVARGIQSIANIQDKPEAPPPSVMSTLQQLAQEVLGIPHSEVTTPTEQMKGVDVDVDPSVATHDMGHESVGTPDNPANENTSPSNDSKGEAGGEGASGAGAGAGAGAGTGGSGGDTNDGGTGAFRGGAIRMAEGGGVKVQDAVPYEGNIDPSTLTDEELAWLTQPDPYDPRSMPDPEDLETRTGFGSTVGRVIFGQPNTAGRTARGWGAGLGTAGAGTYALTRSAARAPAGDDLPLPPVPPDEGARRPAAEGGGGGGGGRGAAPAAAASDARERRDRERQSRFQTERDRLMAEDSRRNGLSPMDIAIMQMGLNMMGSTRKSPLAALAEGANPAIRTYVDLDRNDRSERESRNRRLSDLAYREAMMERYDDDRASREDIARENRAIQLARIARTGSGGGRGGGGAASRADDRAYWSLRQRIATETDPAKRRELQALLGERFRDRAGGTEGGGDTNDRMGLR